MTETTNIEPETLASLIERYNAQFCMAPNAVHFRDHNTVRFGVRLNLSIRNARAKMVEELAYSFESDRQTGWESVTV